ncbi:hypothetical protein [Flavobacterium sp.]|jgi:hypothetical protein|uniref:hypothetical protein n=1 Tax=Flavobacterium sp. TaxID=239 RepID=UPI0037C1185E
MKKLFTLLALVITLITNAQAPQGFNYQATLRNSTGALILNQIVLVKFNVYQNTATGNLVYSENQTANTDDLGHINLVVGQGTATTGSFSAINWGTGNYYLGIELNTGSGYVAMGTTQLLSVPYALYANSAGNTQAATPNLASVLAVNNGGNNLQIKNIADPTDAKDAVTKQYVDLLQAQINILQQQINNNLISQYPAGSVFCASGPTQIVPVLNPITGKVWMDRNLGASQVATSSTDALAYGDLYQWGRRVDGHQCRNSSTTSILSSSDQPTHGNFILSSNTSLDWRSPQNNNLWQGVNGVNNPCPIGYRLPTELELNAERTSWSSNDLGGAFASPLKLPMGGGRNSSGSLIEVGNDGYCWSSTISGTSSVDLAFGNGDAQIFSNPRVLGLSIRCIKN